jgi:camphor 5-monooxygenase
MIGMHDPDYNSSIPAHIPPALVHDHNIYDYDSKDPFLAIHELLESGVPEVFWTRNNGGHWVVLGAEANTALASDPVLFSATRLMVPDHANSDTMSFPPNDTDPPIHKEYRSVIAPLFTPARIALAETKMREVSDALIEDILGRGECEFVADFAAQMPVVVFLTLLDLPLEHRVVLRQIGHRVLYPKDDDHRATPLQELADYLTPIIEDRIRNPRNDAISYILTQKVGGRDLTSEEMMKLTRSTLLGGLDTVPSMLAYFARYLADAPQARRRLLAEPQAIKPAIEEILRRFPVSHIGRMVSADTTFRGVQMKKGEHIVWSVGMYNFDGRRFPDPMKVDFDRKRTAHATFGVGEHFCVGSMLARAELRIFAEHWLPKIPEFHVKPGATVRYRGGFNINYSELPLVVGPVADTGVAGGAGGTHGQAI